jgi:hypothetical protein
MYLGSSSSLSIRIANFCPITSSGLMFSFGEAIVSENSNGREISSRPVRDVKIACSPNSPFVSISRSRFGMIDHLTDWACVWKVMPTFAWLAIHKLSGEFNKTGPALWSSTLTRAKFL